jgi:hypothetical protein
MESSKFLQMPFQRLDFVSEAGVFQFKFGMEYIRASLAESPSGLAATETIVFAFHSKSQQWKQAVQYHQ